MERIHIEQTLRPNKILIIIPKGDKEALLKAIEVNTFFWGGRFNPIVELNNKNLSIKSFNGTIKYTPKDLLEGHLKAFDPDFILPLGLLEKDLSQIDFGDRQILNLNNGVNSINFNDKPIDKNNMVRRWFKPLLKSLRFDTSMRFHDLRHTYASIMLSSGVSYLYVCKQMRHSKPSVTLDIYAHFIPDSRKQDVKIIGQKFSEQIVNIEEYRALKKRVKTLLI